MSLTSAVISDNPQQKIPSTPTSCTSWFPELYPYGRYYTLTTHSGKWRSTPHGSLEKSPLEYNWGHWRSKTLNWGHWVQNSKTTPRDAIFCMRTHMIPMNNGGYVNLPSEVKRGHQRSKLRGHCKSKIANLGHTLMKIVWDAFLLYIYTLIVSIDICNHNILTVGVIRGHCRSKTSK